MNFLFEQSARQNIAKGIIATSVNVTNQLPARNQDNHDLSSRGRADAPAQPPYTKFHMETNDEQDGVQGRVAVISYPSLPLQTSQESA